MPMMRRRQLIRFTAMLRRHFAMPMRRRYAALFTLAMMLRRMPPRIDAAMPPDAGLRRYACRRR